MRKKITSAAVLFFGAVLFSASFAARETTMLPGSVKNFELPNFDENTGLKEWELFGDTASYVSDSRIDISGMRLNLFDAKNNSKFKAAIKSPLASVNPETRIVSSDSAINVSGDGFFVDGRKWRWSGDKKFIEIFSDVKIDFKPADKKSPDTKISSGYASLDHGKKNNLFELKKDVNVVNSDMDLKCDDIRLETGRDTSGVGKIWAAGNVKMRHDNRDTEAGRAEIDAPKGTAVLTENPKITDIASKAELSGDTIILDKNAKKVTAFAGAGKKARTVFYHQADGKMQKITVDAAEIAMVSNNSENVFDFKGGVKIFADDFKADCDVLKAVAKNDEKSKPEVRSIKGWGNVGFSNENGEARGKEMEIIPAKSEIWLTNGAELDDPARGMKLKAFAMVFERAKNRGFALSNPDDAKSFVEVFMNESPDIEAVAGARQTKKKNSQTVIKSRRLNFSRDAESMTFVFSRDVSIASENTNAVCDNMEVLALNDKKSSANIKKITASGGVVVKQKGYVAESEIAVIYPRLKLKDGGLARKREHKYVELSVSPDKPEKRPTVTLPAMGNLGMKDSQAARKAESKPTVITSDKQWLASVAETDKYFFKGNVVAVGTDMNASCQSAEVVMKPRTQGANKEISQVILTDDVKLEQGLKEVHCGRADIYAEDEMIALSDNPVVINREDNTRAAGHRIIYNKGKQSVTVEDDPNRPAPKVDAPASPAFEPVSIPLPAEDEDAPAKPRPTIQLPQFGKK